MKKVSFGILLSLLATMIFSCQEAIDNLLTFEFDTTNSVTIPSTVALDTPLSVPTPDVSTSSIQEFETNNVSTDNIESVTVKEMTLTITSPDGRTFSFLKSISIYIEAEGLDEQLVASKTDIDNTVGTSLELDTEDTNLAEFLKQDNFNLRTEVVTDELITSDTDIDINTTYEVKASLL